MADANNVGLILPNSTEALEYHGSSFLFPGTYFYFPLLAFISES